MNTRLQTRTKAAAEASFRSEQPRLLGGSPDLTGECAECEGGKGVLPRNANHQSAPGAGFSLARSPVIQPNLTSPSNDPLEQEAEGIFEQVSAASGHSSVGVAPLSLQRFTVQATWQVRGTDAQRGGSVGLLWHRATSTEVIHVL